MMHLKFVNAKYCRQISGNRQFSEIVCFPHSNRVTALEHIKNTVEEHILSVCIGNINY